MPDITFRAPVALSALTQPCRRFPCRNSESEYHRCMDGRRNETPTERAPCLLVFGDLAPRVAKLVRARPILIAHLIMAPREAVHAIGAFLHLAPEAAHSDAEVAE